MIRKMKIPEDVSGVVETIDAFDEDDAEHAKSSFEDPSGHQRHYVYVENDTILGVCGAMKDEEEGKDIWWLGWTYVHPEHFRQGIGQRLLDETLLYLHKKRCRKLYVDVSHLSSYSAARNFYTKNGFVVEGVLKDFYDDGEDMIVMGLRVL